MLSEVQFLKSHERLILVLTAIVVFLILGNHWINSSADLANAKLGAAQEQLKAAQVQADKFTQLAQQQQAQFNQVTAQLEAQNEKLVAAVTARQAATKKQQDADKTLPPKELAQRWESLANLQPNDVKPTTDGEYAVTASAAIATVVTLEEVPSLKAALTDTQALVTNKSQELDAATKTVTALNSQVTGLNGKFDAKDKECKQEIDTLKANERRSKRNWFLRGAAVGIGIVTAIVLHY